MNDIQISRMTESDINDSLLQIEIYSNNEPWSKVAFLNEIKNTSGRYIVAEANGKILGFTGMKIIFDEAHICTLAVDKNFRCMGIATKLIEELVNIARDEKITKMTLEVRESNVAARRLYAKCGFKEEGIRKDYYIKKVEDLAMTENAIIMWKYDI